MTAVIQIMTRPTLSPNHGFTPRLIETEDGVQRMTVREMFGDFQALKICIG